MTVNFEGITNPSDTEAYLWNFGEGEEISTSPNPIHVYRQPGVYSVRLEVTDISGIKNTVEKKMIIHVFPKPTARFMINPETVKLPDEVLKTTNLSLEADSYEWDFGDGTSSVETEPEHRYEQIGEYPRIAI